LHTLGSKHDWSTPIGTLRTLLKTLIHLFFHFSYDLSLISPFFHGKLNNVFLKFI
jgi:hypothetical protein